MGNVRSEIVASRVQLAHHHFSVADIEQQERLDGVDIGTTATIEFILDDVE
jgi:hypothetical protein